MVPVNQRAVGAFLAISFVESGIVLIPVTKATWYPAVSIPERRIREG